MADGMLHVDRDDELYVPVSAEPSPLRKLALVVLANNIREAEMNITGRSRLHPANRTLPVMSAMDWLERWDVVEPWCLIAEIPPRQLKRRIEALTACAQT